MKNEVVSNLYHYAVQFAVTLAGALVDITPRTGSFFQTQSGNPYVTNWRNFGTQNEKMTITGLYGKLKGATSRGIWLDFDSPIYPELATDIPEIFKNFLESLFLTVRVNQKEYLEKVPAILLPSPLQNSDSPGIATLAPDAYGGTALSTGIIIPGETGQSKSTPDNGYSLRDGIDICHGDVFDVRYQLDGLDRTLSVLQTIADTISFQRGDNQSFSFFYDLYLSANVIREVQ